MTGILGSSRRTHSGPPSPTVPAWAAVVLPSGFDARIGVLMNGVRFRN